MPVDYKVEVARQLCTALGYAHSRGVVHGRLSSHNVFLENRHVVTQSTFFDPD